jgi:hypothetical protein
LKFNPNETSNEEKLSEFCELFVRSYRIFIKKMLKILIFSYFLLFSEAANEYEIRKLSCQNLDESVIKLDCHYTVNTTSVKASFPQPLRDLKVDLFCIEIVFLINFALKLKLLSSKNENGTLKSILKTKIIDWCAAVAGKSRAGVTVSIIINSLKVFAPHALQECPLSRSLEVKEFAIPKPFVMLYQAGDFEFFCTLYSKGKEVVKINMDTTYT